MLWNEDDVGHNYKPLIAWSTKVSNAFKSDFSDQLDADVTALTNLKNYLSVRPLNRDLDRWADYWHDCFEKGVKIPEYHDLAISGHPDLKGTKPPEFLGGNLAMSCANYTRLGTC
jgi:hypothetical protein